MDVLGARPNQARRHPRKEIPGRVFIHDEEHVFVAPIHNISRGGIFISKLVSLELGQKVKVVIKSPAFSGPIQARGTIVRVETENRLGTAVEFDWIDPQGLCQL